MRPDTFLVPLSGLMFLAAFAFFLAQYITEAPMDADYNRATLSCVAIGMLFGMSAFVAKARRRWRLSTRRAVTFYAGLVLSIAGIFLSLAALVLPFHALAWTTPGAFILIICGMPMMRLATIGVRPDEPKPEQRGDQGHPDHREGRV